ncbi:MAG: DUF2442 domain-containing protein [bacterium]|nr:DUF2442 domain-containing protein [bacterium]
MLELREARYVSGYTIHIALSDGTCGNVDLEDSLWGTVFQPLRAVEEFRKFTISPDLHTIVWPNDADFAPEHLKRKLIEQTHGSMPATQVAATTTSPLIAAEKKQGYDSHKVTKSKLD